MSDEELGHGGMTDCEYDFLLAKAEGRIPATTGWAEWRLWWEEKKAGESQETPRS